MVSEQHEGSTIITMEVCVGCKWLRLELEFNKYVRGVCWHPALEYCPQSIGIDDTVIPAPFATPEWCVHKKIEENKNKLKDEID